jgi:hypothetical protein
VGLLLLLLLARAVLFLHTKHGSDTAKTVID